MCTLVAWVGAFAGHPLVIAANRDENLGRASAGPERHAGAVPYVAPVDRVAGGHWWALNDHGLFVGLTNRAGAIRAADRRSRGLLVADLAQLGGFAQAAAQVESLEPASYNGFHLLVTDGRHALQAVCDGETMGVDRLSPGLHVLTERGFGAAPQSRDERVRRRFERVAAPDLGALEAGLSSHDDPPIDALCVHVPEADYGTLSSTILVRGAGGEQRLRFAPGSPCTTAYEEIAVPRAPAW